MNSDIVLCTKDDLVRHYNLVANTVSVDTDVDLYKESMKTSIESKTAFYYKDDKAIIYYNKTSNKIADGILIYAKCPYAMVYLLSKVFNKPLDSHTAIIKFNPHEKTYLNTFRLLSGNTAIKNYINGHTQCIEVNVSKLRDKFSSRGIECQQ